MGTPDFAVPALDALIAAGHEVARVYTQPPRAAGRGQRAQPSPVQRFAEARGLVARTPATLRGRGEAAEFAVLGLDAAVVAAYGLLLPEAFLAAPRLGCLNIHASLLPRWRGAAPIQRAILAGDVESGVCIMRMEKGLDTGAVLLEARTPIGATESAGELHDRLAALGAKLIVEALDCLGELKPVPQDGAEATYAEKLSKEEARLDWKRPAAELARAVRAYNPWPVAHTQYEGQPLRVWRAKAVASPSKAAPGTVVAAGRDGVDVACAEGSLRLLELQAAGGRVQEAAAFANGRELKGRRFG